MINIVFWNAHDGKNWYENLGQNLLYQMRSGQLNCFLNKQTKTKKHQKVLVLVSSIIILAIFYERFIISSDAIFSAIGISWKLPTLCDAMLSAQLFLKPFIINCPILLVFG